MEKAWNRGKSFQGRDSLPAPNVCQVACVALLTLLAESIVEIRAGKLDPRVATAVGYIRVFAKAAGGGDPGQHGLWIDRVAAPGHNLPHVCGIVTPYGAAANLKSVLAFHFSHSVQVVRQVSRISQGEISDEAPRRLRLHICCLALP